MSWHGNDGWHWSRVNVSNTIFDGFPRVSFFDPPSSPPDLWILRPSSTPAPTLYSGTFCTCMSDDSARTACTSRVPNQSRERTHPNQNRRAVVCSASSVLTRNDSSYAIAIALTRTPLRVRTTKPKANISAFRYCRRTLLLYHST